MRRITRKAQQGFTLIELMIVVAIVGILAVLAIYGVSKYMTNAKTAEARNALGMVGKASVSAYEGENASTEIIAPGTSGEGVNHALCRTAAPVPAELTSVANKKYQSSNENWFSNVNPRVGWTCLKFSLTEPQYFQDGYESAADDTATGFSAWAESDMKAEGKATLSFELKGAIDETTKQLVVATQINEINGSADKTIGTVGFTGTK